MDTLNYNKFLLKTAFSCMACDGDIHKQEITLIKQLHETRNLFGQVDIVQELDTMLVSINHDGHKFLKGYFEELDKIQLTSQEELHLIEVAIDTIKADDEIHYSEVKFFKVIRSKLKIEDEKILEKHPDFEEYLEQDIMSPSYLARLKDDFFDTHTLSELKADFEISQDSIIKTTEEKEDPKNE